ncbi:hypothetical protein KFL_000500100 [Klebsormidium nitens]|uniref:Uncharacterized protein n=1 Tax=Klebsormidium nitens TaxID=105231 RepID=A0A1Y1HWN2_KLENI|nr:hypothetical protein KFL_000500100 [Klebsormidium nitens]|eukprot:GAQ80258.1 hypothetical protein KFL_000500100 [Klebsormidium nitens]
MAERRRWRGASREDGGNELVCPRAAKMPAEPHADLMSKARRRRNLVRGEEVGRELVDILLAKKVFGEPSCPASPPFLACSPPSRAGNPVIKDARFSFHSIGPSGLGASCQAFRPCAAAVRVEGFAEKTLFSPPKMSSAVPARIG